MVGFWGTVFVLFLFACLGAGLREKENRKKSSQGRTRSLLCKDEENEQRILEHGGWKCECGRVNPRHTGTCACGRHRDSRVEKEIRKKTPVTEVEKEVEYMNFVSRDEWECLVREGNSWASTSVYIDKDRKRVKVVKEECSHWGYHDESEWDEEEYVITIEEAIERFASHHSILCKLKKYVK